MSSPSQTSLTNSANPGPHSETIDFIEQVRVNDNWNIAAAGKRGPALLQNIWFVNKTALFDREFISERRMHASVDDGRTNLKEVVYAEVRR